MRSAGTGLFERAISNKICVWKEMLHFMRCRIFMESFHISKLNFIYSTVSINQTPLFSPLAFLQKPASIQNYVHSLFICSVQNLLPRWVIRVVATWQKCTELAWEHQDCRRHCSVFCMNSAAFSKDLYFFCISGKVAILSMEETA